VRAHKSRHYEHPLADVPLLRRRIRSERPLLAAELEPLAGTLRKVAFMGLPASLAVLLLLATFPSRSFANSRDNYQRAWRRYATFLSPSEFFSESWQLSAGSFMRPAA